MDFPPFPVAINNPQTGALPKKDIKELTRLYDMLIGVGLNPIPKDRLNKKPIDDLWKGEKRLPKDRIEALKLQAMPKSSGWFIVPSLETKSLVIIDLDVADIRAAGLDPEHLYTRIQAMSLTRFVVYTPANGLHLFYELETDQEPPNNIHPRPDYPGLELRTKTIGTGVATLGSYARYEKGAKKGVSDNHTGEYRTAPYGEYDEIPKISQTLLDWLKEGDKPLPKQGEEFGITLTGNRMVKSYESLEPDRRLKITLEAVDHALKDWDNSDYGLWLQLWMSAHHASDGNELVAEYIQDHPNVIWSDGNKGRKKFIRDWRDHVPQSGGYTVASLMYLAMRNGWMQTSQADIKEEDFDTLINTERVSVWIEGLETIPKHVALKSQTGSGKTFGIKALWAKLEEPKTLVLVPSIKLALDMASTLRDDLGMPAVAYRDEETLETKEALELLEAKVLVTTLQTFVKKLYYPGFMHTYGLVYIEECDQLLQQFSKALGEKASHVSQEQAEQGFQALQEAFNTCYVWGVDATMTQVTLTAFKFMAGIVTAVNNTYIADKPNVYFLETKLEAYNQVCEALRQGKNVVVACDTKNEAESLVQTMVRIKAVKAKEALAITADTGGLDERVIEFARDANKHAPNYRLISYNSAMASGVSVISCTPDVVVQISSGWLSPRTQLQILNRYRKQNKVYCYYQQRSEMPLELDEKQLVEAAKTRAIIEADWLSMPLIERSDLAGLRDLIRAIAQADDTAQRRNPIHFYKRLLRSDGRGTVDSSIKLSIAAVEEAYLANKEERKAFRELLASTWNQVPPSRERVESYSEIDQRRAYVHQWLIDIIQDIPTYEKPDYVYAVVRSLYKKQKALTAFVLQHKAIRNVERAIANKERGYLSQSQAISRTVLAAMLRYLFVTPDEELTNELLKGRVKIFNRIIEDNDSLYHAVVRNHEKSLKALHEKAGGDPTKYAILIARSIGSTIGLHIKSRRAGEGRNYYIANLEEIMDFVAWLHRDAEFEFTSEIILEEKEARRKVSRQLATMSEQQIERLMDKIVNDNLAIEVALQANRY